MRPQEIDALRIAIEALIRQYPEIAEDEVLRADMLEAETPLDEVLTGLIRMEEDARALREGTKEQLERLKARADRFTQRVEASRTLMMALLSAADLRKRELPEGTIYLRNNPQQIIGQPDASTLPDDLVKVERKPDKVAIKEALKAGRVIEGLQLSNAPPSVVVTIK